MEEFNLTALLHLPTTPAPPLESLIVETTSKTSQRIKSQRTLFFFFFRKEMSKNEFFLAVLESVNQLFILVCE